MLGCVSISRRAPATAIAPLLLLAVFAFGGGAARAADGGKAAVPEEEDFTPTPFTEYGQFDDEEDEEAETKFFQYGRFYGVSLGSGMSGALGNRGKLWKGGFPVIDIRAHYWFDFQFALDLGFTTVNHYYETTDASGENRVNVAFQRIGVDFKYYFDTKDLSAPISFTNPHLALGIGSFTKTEASFFRPAETDADGALGISMGAGVEFVLSPRRSYLQLEGRLHSINFKDTRTDRFLDANGLDDLTGMFYSAGLNLLFTY